MVHHELEPGHFDLHKLITVLIFAGALVSVFAVSTAVFVAYQQMGTAVFSLRADHLGDYIHSPLAYVFNIGLLAAGCCMMLSMAGLYLLKLNSFSQYMALAGAWVGISICLMGIFPINYLAMHRLVSTGYLLGSLVLHALTMVAGFNRRFYCPKPLCFISCLTLVSAITLATELDWYSLDFPQCDTASQTCIVAPLMWAMTNLTIIWCLTLALAMRKMANKIKHNEPSLLTTRS